MIEALNEISKSCRHLIFGVTYSIQYYNYKILVYFLALVNISNKAILKHKTKKYSKTSKNQARLYHLLKAILEAIKQLVTARSLNDWTINLSSAFELHKSAI